ncbi:MAG: hypothetical protein ACKPKO_31270, partial [Candidatus Fonsibacter sp.]
GSFGGLGGVSGFSTFGFGGLSKLKMLDCHYNVIHKNFEGQYNLIYSDTDSLVYNIKHDDIYEWIKIIGNILIYLNLLDLIC